jgi:FAD/FMN-containing dehydrogenase
MTETSWLSAAVLGDVVASPAAAHRHRWGLGPSWHGSLVFARCEHDVVAAVRTASRSGTGVLARSGPWTSTPADDDEIVVVTAGLDHVEVDPVAREARVGVGATWRQVARATARHGLAPVHGDDPDVTVGADVCLGVDGPWARGLGPVRAGVGSVDAVGLDGRLVTVAGCEAITGEVPAVPTSVRLGLVDAAPVTVFRCRDLASERRSSVQRFLVQLDDLPAQVAAAAVVPARADAPVTWWLAVRGSARPPAGWPDLDVEVSRRPAGAVLRWPPVPGRGVAVTTTVGADARDDVLAAVGGGATGGAVVLRHRGADPSGTWLDVVAYGRAVGRIAGVVDPLDATRPALAASAL